jgi:hypothetical protein
MLVSSFCLFIVRGSMRQILIGAWLVLVSSAITACDGEAFAPGASSEDDGSPDPSSPNSKSGSPGRGSSAGTSNTSAGGVGTAGGASNSAGGSTVVPPGAAGESAAGGSGNGEAGMGSAAEDCAEGKVTFKMLPGADMPKDYVCDASCGTGWLTITDAHGASALSIFSACGTASCESCEILPCAAAVCQPTSLTAEGTELTWSGTYLKEDTCGANLACQRQTCVAPGKYRAKACANVNAGANGMDGACMPKDGIVVCSEAEFDFPSTSEVLLVLEQP